mmetsp:Transcript_24375/g.59688  ORF Transcript_24375/g.59688 Transcript_24375/m.59688 type:complete len:92 (-) Transcript_24375:398-673(-)
MICVYTNGYTHTAFVTVAKCVSAPNSTKSTFCAMKRLLGLRHPKITGAAMVLAKNGFAVDTLIGCLLPSIAQLADYFSHKESIHCWVTSGT